jgi:hypothetical protein
VAVLNGEDDLLEVLWAMDREKVFRALIDGEIAALSGPTFSVYGESASHPASHNIAMLTRHHRFCAEAATAGLTVIPNLYWRNGTDRDTWARWLDNNPEVTWIARDFSRTKQRSCFEPEFKGLLQILDSQPRILNVLFTGVGEEKLDMVQRQIRERGGHCSFVTARPIVAPHPASGDSVTGVWEAIAHFRRLAEGESEVHGKEDRHLNRRSSPEYLHFG